MRGRSGRLRAIAQRGRAPVKVPRPGDREGPGAQALAPAWRPRRVCRPYALVCQSPVCWVRDRLTSVWSSRDPAFFSRAQGPRRPAPGAARSAWSRSTSRARSAGRPDPRARAAPRPRTTSCCSRHGREYLKARSTSSRAGRAKLDPDNLPRRRARSRSAPPRPLARWSRPAPARGARRGEAAPFARASARPAHHAERLAPMGFCVFNNVAGRGAGAARTCRRPSGSRSSTGDVHHGNGTQHLFRKGRAATCSSPRCTNSPFYPGTRRRRTNRGTDAAWARP